MRRKNEEKEIEPIPSRNILLDLTHAKPVLLQLKEFGKEYNPLIDVLIAIGEDDPLPKSKELQTQFNITPAKLRKWLETLHEDFLNGIYNDETLLSFPVVKTIVSVKGFRRSTGFSCQLPFIPRVGEMMKIPFLKAICGHDSYHVERVTYELVNGVAEIWIGLKPGSYDQYFEFLKHRARFENRIGFREEYQMSDYELENFLRKLYR